MALTKKNNYKISGTTFQETFQEHLEIAVSYSKGLMRTHGEFAHEQALFLDRQQAIIITLLGLQGLSGDELWMVKDYLDDLIIYIAKHA